jgi:hypothetical protein
MTKQQIESWAIDVLDKVRTGKKVDDPLVEMRHDWPEPAVAARLIAGHANMARGQTILWLMGADEAAGIKQITHRDPALWLPQVDAYFDGVAPDTWAMPMVYNGVRLTALITETDRAPYVVKIAGANQPADSPSTEVPYRTGKKTHSAGRVDLLRMMVPASKTPDVSVLDSKLLMGRPGQSSNFHAYVQFDLYIVPTGKETLVYPYRRSRAWALFQGPHQPLEIPVTGGSGFAGSLITPTQSELIVNGPGQISVIAQIVTPRFSYVANKPVSVHMELVHATGSAPIRAKSELAYNGPKIVTIGTAQFEDSWGLVR